MASGRGNCEGTGPFTEVELHVSARNIQDKDLFSSSDPFCVLFQKKLNSEEFVEVDRTEAIKDTLNPDFVKKFKIDYFHQEVQQLKFEVYDQDSTSRRLSKHDCLGEVFCTLEEIVDSRRLEKPILYKGKQRRRDCGSLCVTVEDIGDSNDVVTLQFQAFGLDKMDTFGKSDPYLTFYRTNRDRSTTIVYRTEIIKKTLNPSWKEFTIPVRMLCANNYDRKIIVNCWDWNKTSSDEYAGECEMTLASLKDGPGESNVYKITKPEKVDTDKNYDNSGSLVLVKCEIEQRQSFSDYIQAGSKIIFSLAFDCAMPGDEYRHYKTVLVSLASTLEYYNKTDAIKMFGFRESIEDNESSSKFYVKDPTFMRSDVEDIIKVLGSDSRSSEEVCCSNDVISLIEHIKNHTAANGEGIRYHAVLVFANNFSDGTQSKLRDALKHVCSLPISVIVLGFGEFTEQACPRVRLP
ncbi:copine-5-like isoform X2 [Ptychodera flava]|uniref:copine-5-like isoform X2 n=1 Tax=Ptychodera flava TaxID=63121 RepID=UPI003969CF88